MKVRLHDQGEIRDALRRLGSSESEALLYRGTVSVEGIHDAEILHSGFDNLLRRYRVRQRGGRGQVEVDIAELQKAEKNGDEIGRHFFIFDNDNKPTGLVDSASVKILQLPIYCLENYLLDAEIITDLSREREFALQDLPSITDTDRIMKQQAMSQLTEIAARIAFKQLDLEKICFDMSIFKSGSRDSIANQLQAQLEAVSMHIEHHTVGEFSNQFKQFFDMELEKLTIDWDEKWRERCNGKRLFDELRKKGVLRGDLQKFKKRIMTEMRQKETKAWKSLHSLILTLLGTE